MGEVASHPASLEAIRAAAARIAGHAHRTPILTSETLDAMAARRLFFKAEVFQKVGAFKFRGAMNAVSRLADEAAARGVVTHSSGNHAQALALAAKLRGIPAWIVMPKGAPAIKRRAVEGYGATVVECENTLEARESTAARVVAETGGTLIPPFDHPDVIAGQGTMALEILEERPETEAIVVPIGGGGMISGVAIAATRVVIGAHHPSDMLAGFLLGWTIAVSLARTAPNWWPATWSRIACPIGRKTSPSPDAN